jgi:hypothetical protein
MMHVDSRAIDFPNLSRDIRVEVTLVARPLLMPLAQELCRCEYVYSQPLLSVGISQIKCLFE